MMIQLMIFKKTNLRKTLDLSESLESNVFVDELEEAVKSKKNKEKKGRQKTFHNELLEIQKQQLKLFEELEKRFQAFQPEMLEKQLQSEAVEKRKDREFFLQFGKMFGQDNNNSQFYIFFGTIVLLALWSSFVRYSSSRSQMFYAIGALKIFAKSTEKTFVSKSLL